MLENLQSVSILIPIYNEEENINSLYREINNVMDSTEFDYEIIMVDDRSLDRSWEVIADIAKKDKKVKAISFVRNVGQTYALQAGFEIAKKEIIIPLDGDGQNDPHEIPKLIQKLNEGYDVVSGWRHKRKDNLFLRKIPSWIANVVISSITNVHLHDYGCTMKAYRRSIVKHIKLYGEMHRFIPVYASWYGEKVIEVPVNHRPRTKGISKYGIGRTFRVLLDLVTITFLTKYFLKPMYFFGKIGILSIASGVITFLLMLYYKFILHINFTRTPLMVLTAIFFMLGAIIILMGLMSELIMRTYYESQNARPFIINEKINN
jgi:glycosyltransferase involved in cell wall biosynthesis